MELRVDGAGNQRGPHSQSDSTARYDVSLASGSWLVEKLLPPNPLSGLGGLGFRKITIIWLTADNACLYGSKGYLAVTNALRLHPLGSNTMRICSTPHGMARLQSYALGIDIR